MPIVRQVRQDSNGQWWVVFEPPTDLQTERRETIMPARHVNCVDCDDEIDRQYDSSYDVCGDGCCGFRCYGCHRAAQLRDARVSGRGVVHPYSYKPRRYNSKGNYPTEVLMGVELEMGGEKYDIAGRVAEVDSTEDTLYCKEDCSIYGAEIVSHPFTLDWVKNWGGYDALLEKLREDGCGVDSEDCPCGDNFCSEHQFGLHVHVSRNAFQQARKRRVAPEPPAENETYEQRLGREFRALLREQRAQHAINHQMIWLMFLERNADKLNGDDKLARRDSERWGAFKESNLDELRQKARDCQYYGENRYMAINCQNDKTYELRFFKSTVDTEEFYAALEFADASVEYTRTINADNVLRGRALAWSNFVGWINEQKMDTDNGVVMRYANLISQINTLGL